MELLARVTRRRIGLVVAAAGYGKSVAVAHYLRHTGVPSIWFVVRQEHTKLLGFAWGLAHALGREVPSLERGLLGAYQSVAPGAETPVALAAWFAGQLDDCSQTIVVDDVHVALEEPSVRDFLVALIERTHKGLRWLLLGRSALDLPLATWLAYGHADEPAGMDDLRIWPGEAASIAQACDVALSRAELDELLELTAGWPAAFIFALRAAAGGTELGRIAIETREKLYAYLADQAFGAFSPSEQQFLLGTALLPAIDLELLAAAGWDSPQATYARLRRNAGFIVPESATTFHYHALFAEFLQHRLRLLGAATYRRTQLQSAVLLDAADRPDLALRLRVAAKDRAGVVRMLRDQASKSTLGGTVDAIEEAFGSLPPQLFRADPELLDLLARTRVLRSAWDEADTLYRTAVELAETPDQRAKLSLSYASALYRRRGHEAAFAALCDLDANRIEDSSTRTRLLSRLAVLRAMRGEFEEAARLATQSLAATVLGAPDLRAIILFNACLVSHYSDRLAEARSRAVEARKAAEQSGNDQCVARSCHVLCLLAMNDGDWVEATDLMAQSILCAKRDGEVTVINDALDTALFLASIRGDAARISELEALLGRGFCASRDSEVARSSARAIRAAWSGDFGTARREADHGIGTTGQSDDVPLLFFLPQVAVYHAAAGDREAALQAFDRTTTFLNDFATSRMPLTYATFVNIGRILLAVAAALTLRSRTANDILLELERSDPKPIGAVRRLVQAARTLNRVAQGVAEREALDRDLEAVREAGLGGYADLLAMLPVGKARNAAAFGTLTKAEMQMLRLIARGGTMKTIAAGLNRSPDTVETHIRSILRKLDCKSRNEAVAFARDHGII
jgi:LuxR family maltose regulon positive regulatory protein